VVGFGTSALESAALERARNNRLEHGGQGGYDPRGTRQGAIAGPRSALWRQVQRVGRKAVPYAIITRDKPNSLQLRNDTRAEHLDYLTKRQDLLLAAGAQVDDAGQGGYGGILIVDTEDRAEAEAFIRDDPFTKAGLFSGIEVVRWRKAFFDKKRLV
jgi:uncharacterized protein YciI